MRGILSKLPGAEGANVDFANKTATVKVKSDFPVETITEAVNKSGRFKATVKQ